MNLRCLSLAVVLSGASLLASAQAQLDVGSASQVTPFATFSGNDLSNASLSEHEGKVVVVNYYTPW